jgi:hypothetical protein
MFPDHTETRDVLANQSAGRRTRGPGHGDEGEAVTNQVPKYVTRAGACLLLGITEADLSRIAKESGLGRLERAGTQEETYFTYEELEWIRKVATNQAPAAPGNRIEGFQVGAASNGPSGIR